MNNKLLKIAFVWEQDSWGGVDSYLNYLLSAWPEKEDRITLFYNTYNEGADRLSQILPQLPYVNFVPFPSVFVKKKKSVHRSLFARFFLYTIRPFLLIIMVRRLYRLFKYESYDVLISQNGGYPAAWGALAAIIAAKNAGIPVRTLVIHHQATKPTVFMHTFRQVLDRYIAKTSTSIVTVSSATKNSLLLNTFLLEDEENIHVRVIYNGVPVNSFSNVKKLDYFSSRSVLTRNINDLLIGIVGRIEPYKGQEDLIFAFSRLSLDLQAKARILIIGKGNDNEVNRLKHFCKNLMLEDRVEFLGYVPGDIKDIIYGLDLLVMATRSFEGFGLTPAEAMSLKVPVLVTRVGAIPEFIDATIAEIVDPGAIDQLVISLEDFFNNTQCWKDRTARAELHIRKFSASRMAKEYRDHILQKYLSI